MINFILNLLEKIPYRTRFGLSIADVLKVRYYHRHGKQHIKCLCGGTIITVGIGPDGWETACRSCEFLYDED
jgi:hypothetical protein